MSQGLVVPAIFEKWQDLCGVLIIIIVVILIVSHKSHIRPKKTKTSWCGGVVGM